MTVFGFLGCLFWELTISVLLTIGIVSFQANCRNEQRVGDIDFLMGMKIYFECIAGLEKAAIARVLTCVPACACWK